MLSHVILLQPKYSRYNAFHTFLHHIAAAYERRGTRVSSFDLGQLDREGLLHVLQNENPDATLCFNGVLPEPGHASLTDVTGLPHFCWLVDPPTRLSAMATEPHTAVACVDRHSCTVFDELGCLETMFLPHAVHPELEALSKDIDVLLPGSFIDPRELYASWKERYGQDLASWMRELAEQIHDDSSHPPYRHLMQATSLSCVELFSESWRGVSLVELWHSMEFYVRGLERCHLLDQLANFKVQIIGEGWGDYIAKKHPQVNYHGSVSYEQSLQWTQRSRVLINSNPLFRDGSHDRLFSGLAAGCVVVNNRCPFVDQAFGPGHGVIAYTDPRESDLSDRICTALSGQLEAEKRAGRERVMAEHLWDHRLPAIDAAVERCRRLL